MWVIICEVIGLLIVVVVFAILVRGYGDQKDQIAAMTRAEKERANFLKDLRLAVDVEINRLNLEPIVGKINKNTVSGYYWGGNLSILEFLTKQRSAEETPAIILLNKANKKGAGK